MAIRIYPGWFFHAASCVVCVALLGCGGPAQSNLDTPAPNLSAVQQSANADETTLYAFTMNNIDGWPIPLSRYQGKVLLVVNVASECRYTDQYRNLQRLYMKYKDRGFVVLGFPANNFGRQEPGTDAEIKDFTSRQFNIMFPLFSKISVHGEDIHPLYQCLTSPQRSGEFAGPITWNFNKFLIDKNGKTIARFASETDPLDPQITAAIEAALR